VHPEDAIHYSLDLDLTSGEGTDTKGAIYRRHDVKLDILMTTDWRAIKVRRWSLVGDAWDAGKTYGRKETCQVGNRLFISLDDDNLNNEPVSTDTIHWMTMVYDVTSRPYLKYIAPFPHSAVADPGPEPDREKSYQRSYAKYDDIFYGFYTDLADFQDFYPIAFLDEIDNSSGVHAGLGLSMTGIHVYPLTQFDVDGVPEPWSVMTGNVIMLENTPLIIPNFGDFRLGGARAGWLNTFRPYNYHDKFDTTAAAGIKNMYVTGTLGSSMNGSGSGWMSESFLRGMSYSQTQSDGIEKTISNIQSDDFSTTRGFNGLIIHAVDCVLYAVGRLHDTDIHLERSTIGGTGGFSNCKTSYLTDSKIMGNLDSCVFSTESGRTGLGVGGSGNNIAINADIADCTFINVNNITINSTLERVRMNWADGITIPANISLYRVSFNMPNWVGKNVWSGDPLELKDVEVNRRWVDDADLPTIERIWYEEVDSNGGITHKELK
ncbi:MAG: hypothetical protein KAH32_02940, partial [Chlamydiia bacterium]|nr:hypothetical protein [Chlamydiia bacterium]